VMGSWGELPGPHSSSTAHMLIVMGRKWNVSGSFAEQRVQIRAEQLIRSLGFDEDLMDA